jgi:hypothetical protein
MTKKRDQSQRIDVAAYGIDLAKIVSEIRPHLEGTYEAIGRRASGMPANNVSRILNGHLKPSLGALAALAAASGGQLIVTYKPPPRSKRTPND